MDHKPRYSQPFTLAEAVLLDIPVISEEISRLQNSLSHLRRTQEELRGHIETVGPDKDIEEALEDNARVIGSQEERVGILKLVLAHKGIPVSSHYDFPQDYGREGESARIRQSSESVEQSGGIDL